MSKNNLTSQMSQMNIKSEKLVIAKCEVNLCGFVSNDTIKGVSRSDVYDEIRRRQSEGELIRIKSWSD